MAFILFLFAFLSYSTINTGIYASIDTADDLQNQSDHLPKEPQDPKEMLSTIFVMMDSNSDGFVDFDELKQHLLDVQKNYTRKLVDDKWNQVLKAKPDFLVWEEFQKSYDHDETSVKRDWRRFQTADFDSNGGLSKEEFYHFYVPESHPKMHSVMIDEILEDLDFNRDGFIDENEYIRDLWRGKVNEGEPEWVKMERHRFSTKRDLDKDKKLSREEIITWILPSTEEYSEDEANSLIQIADTDKDGVLSEEEVLHSHSQFLNSQATNYGQGLEDLQEESLVSIVHTEL